MELKPNSKAVASRLSVPLEKGRGKASSSRRELLSYSSGSKRTDLASRAVDQLEPRNRGQISSEFGRFDRRGLSVIQTVMVIQVPARVCATSSPNLDSARRVSLTGSGETKAACRRRRAVARDDINRPDASAAIWNVGIPPAIGPVLFRSCE